MKKNKLFNKLFAGLLLLQSCQTKEQAVIKGTADVNKSSVSIERIDSTQIESISQSYPVTHDSFEISVKNLHAPEVVLVSFSDQLAYDLLLKPGQLLNLQVKNKRFLTDDPLNSVWIKSQVAFDSIGNSFYQSPHTFSADAYSRSVDLLYTDAIKKIQEQTDNDPKSARLLLQDLETKALYLYSLPLSYDSGQTGTNDREQIAAKYLAELSKNVNRNGYLRNADLFSSIRNYYISYALPKHRTFAGIQGSDAWKVNPDLQMIISTQFVDAYINKEIYLDSTDIQIIKKLLCDKQPVDSVYCSYFNKKISNNVLFAPEAWKDDSLVNSNNTVSAFSDVLNSSSAYVVFWQSDSKQSIELLKNLSSFHNTPLYFLCLDENVTVWKTTSKTLNLPTDRNFLLKRGFKSDLAQKLKLNFVPFIFSIQDKHISDINVPADHFYQPQKKG